MDKIISEPIAAFLNSSSLFITGGTGFFGRSLLRRISEVNAITPLRKYAVTVLSRNPGAFFAQYPEFSSENWLCLVRGDVSNTLDKVDGLESNYSHILHAAADSTVGPQMPLLERYDQIVEGTRNVLDFAVKVGAKRFLLTSSGGVYGAQPPAMEKISEEYLGMPDPLGANNTYSVSKRMAEHLCSLYANKSRLEIVVARCFAFVGPDLPLDAHFAIGNFIGDVLKGLPIYIKGDGSPLRSYLYQSDLADWLLNLVDQGSSGHAYNVGSDKAISILELAQLVKSSLDSDVQIVVQNNQLADNVDRNRYIPNIKKIQQDLGMSITVPLSQAIKLTVQHLKSSTFQVHSNV